MNFRGIPYLLLCAWLCASSALADTEEFPHIENPSESSKSIQNAHAAQSDVLLKTSQRRHQLMVTTDTSVQLQKDFSALVEKLVTTSLEQSQEFANLTGRLRDYDRATNRAYATTKDALNQTFLFEGTDSSQRIGKVVLDGKAEVHDYISAELEQRKLIDQTHLKVISALASVASGAGNSDKIRQSQLILSGIDALTNLVGRQAAISGAKEVCRLTSRLAEGPTPTSKIWDTMQRDKNIELLTTSAVEQDCVVNDLKTRLGHYANISKKKSTISRVVEGGLSTAGLVAPGWTIPIVSEAALDLFIAATGGSEKSKIEKELFYQKCLDSRTGTIRSEVILSVDNYRYSIVTNNRSLRDFSASMMEMLSGTETSDSVLDARESPSDLK